MCQLASILAVSETVRSHSRARLSNQGLQIVEAVKEGIIGDWSKGCNRDVISIISADRLEAISNLFDIITASSSMYLRWLPKVHN